MKKTTLGFLAGFVLALALTLIAGENPFHIAGILFKSAFGSGYDLGLTLFYTTPLIFTGLSVAIAFHGGLFNIGSEGQLLFGALAATATGIFLPQIPFPLAPLLAFIMAILAAGAWGALAGWLRARRGSHEVIVTILLNFVAAGICNWFVLQIIPNPDSQNPESAPIAGSYLLKNWDPLAALAPDSGLSSALIVAILTAIAIWFLLWRTSWGFELRAVGANPEAANRAGIPVAHRRIQAMALAGALAGGVALSEILGHAGQFKIGFSPDYGFIGIAVALLASNNPLGVLFAAFLMGALHKGASDLDLETNTITRDFSKIMQALIILGVGLRAWQFQRRRARAEAK